MEEKNAIAYFQGESPHDQGEVRDIPFNVSELELGVFYRVNDTIYPYLGDAETDKQKERFFKNNCSGGIYLFDGVEKVIEWSTEEEAKAHSITNIRPIQKENKLMENMDPDADIENYIQAYQQGKNLSVGIKIRNTSSESVYVPKIRDEDNAVERLLKHIIIAMKIVSSEYRKKMSKEYKYDNLVSSLDGATKHTSIAKIMEWVKLLELDWEFTVFNIANDVPYPLPDPVVVSNKDQGWVEICPGECAPEIFVVALTEGEDPFKRLIKLALWKKMIPKAEYRSRGATDHQINNLMSALRNKQKMAPDYFEIWCDLLNLGWNIRLTDPKSGIWYNAVGNKITTNYSVEEDELE